MDLGDFKEKMVLVGITAAVFIPLRLVASQYLFEHWAGNLGVATLISLVLVILVKKGKLGGVGRIFRRQITKTLWSRSAKVIVLVLFVFMAYFGTTILLVERGNTVYYADKAILAKRISGEMTMPEPLRLSGPQGDDIVGISQIRYLEYVFSISYAILNDTTDGWLVNLHLIMFMEQVEVLMLLWFFRRYFRPEIPN